MLLDSGEFFVRHGNLGFAKVGDFIDDEHLPHNSEQPGVWKGDSRSTCDMQLLRLPKR